MEITKSLNQYKLPTEVINFFIKSFFYVIRKISRIFTFQQSHIVIISLHKLGDTVFTIPAIKQIQRFYQRKIIIFCYSEVVPIYNLYLTNIDFCKAEHQNFYFGDRIASSKARRKLRSTKPEIIFDFTGVMTSATLIFNSRAKKIIGMSREQFKTIYDICIPIRTKPHLMDRYIDIIATVIPNVKREQIKSFPVDIKREGKIVIHPFGGWKAKEWNLKKFIDIAVRLNEDYNVCLIAPEKSIAEDIVTLLYKERISLVQTQTIQELVEQIKQCSVFIGNDSGPLYIASLFGKPTFTIYGPTNSNFSCPVGEHHECISKKIKCSPDRDKQYCFTAGGRAGCPAFQCMNTLSSEEVFPKLHQFVQKYYNQSVN